MCAWSHGIQWYWFIVHLAVAAWQYLTMFLVVKPPSHQQLSWGESCWHPSFSWKRIQPEHYKVDKLYLQPSRDVLEGESSHNPPGALFNSSDGALSLTHVFLCG